MNTMKRYTNDGENVVGWVKRSLALLLTLAAFGLLVSGCGAGQRTDHSLAWSNDRGSLPESREALVEVAGQPPASDSEALMVAFARMLLADFDGAQQALLDHELLWETTSLRVARLAFLIWNYQNVTDPEVVQRWVAALDLSSLSAVEWVLRDQLAAYTEQDRLARADETYVPTALDFGGAESWTFYGPVARGIALGMDDQGVAGEVPSLRELPVGPWVQRRVVPTLVGAVGDVPSRENTFYLESFLRVDAPSELVFSTFGESDFFSLWLDDTLVFQRLPSDVHQPDFLMQEVRVEPGTYRVLLRIGSSSRGLRDIRARAVQGAITGFAADLGPASSATAPTLRNTPSAVSDWFGDVPKDHVTAWLSAATVAFVGDQNVRRKLVEDAPAPDHPLIVWVRANLVEHLRDYPIAPSEALNALRQVDPAWMPLQGVEMMEAQLAFTAAEDDEAPQKIAAYAFDSQASPHLRRAYASMVGQLGFDALAFKALQQLAQEYPSWCAVWSEYLQRARSYRGTLLESDFASAPMVCPDVRQMRDRIIGVAAGQPAEYQASLARRSQRLPGSLNTYRSIFWQLLRDAGEPAARVFYNTLPHGVFSLEERAAAEAAMAYLVDGSPGAEAVLEETVEHLPAILTPHTALARLRGDQVLQDLRVDGNAALAEYRNAKNKEDTVAGELVYVLDYSAWRYFEEGGGVRVVHQMYELNSRDAVAQMGEIGMPNHGFVLELRVIKPDGTMRTPVQFTEKQSLSLPDLAVGDVVEMEYLEIIAPHLPEHSGERSPNFYFQTGSVPMFRSELIVDYPKAWADDALLEIFHFRGGDYEREEHGAYVRENLRMRNIPSAQNERGAPSPEDYLPWATFSLKRNLDRELDAYTSYVEQQVASAPEIQAQAQKLIDGVTPPSKQVEALFRYVVDDVEMAGGFVSVSALETLRMTRGARLSLLYAMLEAIGLEPQLALVRRFDAPTIRSRFEGTSSYDDVVLYVRAAGKDFWLQTDQELAPFNQLRSDLQGSDALIIAGTRVGETTVVPKAPHLSSLNRSEVELWLDENGDAKIRYRFEYSQEYGADMRTSLVYVPSHRERVRFMEQYLSANYGPATIESLVIEGENDPNDPLVFVMEGVVEGIAIDDGQELYIDRAIEPPASLFSRTNTPARTLPMLIEAPIYHDIDVTIHPPAGYQLTRVMEDSSLEQGENHYERRVTSTESGRVQWRRSVRVQRAWLAPEEYPELVKFSRNVAEMERVRVQWTPSLKRAAR